MLNVDDDFLEQKNRVGRRITPIYLYSICYDVVSSLYLYYTNYIVDVTFDSVTYVKHPIIHSSIKESLSGRADKISLTIGNGDRVFQYYMDNYHALKDCPVRIRLVWKEYLTNPASFLDNDFIVEGGSSNAKNVQLSLGSPLDVNSLSLPQGTYSQYRCRFTFKDANCKYAGVESLCVRTFAKCKEYGNTLNFGGFPGCMTKRKLV